MASRGKYGARFLGHTEREDSRERRAPSPSKRLSAVSTASSASKIPAYTSSFFSRHKNSRNETEPMKGTSDASSKGAIDHTPRPNETTFMRRTESPVKPALQPPRTLGLGIAAGNSLGSPITPVNSEKRPRNVLRRKASGLLDQQANYARTESSVSSYDPAQQNQRHETSSNPGAYRDPFAGSILGVTMPAVSSSTSFLPGITTAPYHQATSSSRMAMYNPRSKPDQLSMRNLSPPTASFAHSSGSSTRRSESPGGFSRTSTPTSMSSHSPGIPLPAKSPLGVRQSSPTGSRPPVTRRGIRNLPPHDDAKLSENQGLSVLRESGTSSSSSSTVKGIERVEVTQVRNPASGLSPPPPSPPPRVSSKQPLQLQDDIYHARNPLTTADVLQRRQPLRSQTTGETGLTKNVFASPSRPLGAPPRPSREGAPKLESGLAPSPIIRSNLRGLVTTGHKRRESLEKSITSPETRHAAPGVPRSSTLPVKPPSRLPSPGPGSIGTLSRPRPPLVFSTKDVVPVDEDGSAGRIKDPSPLSAGPNKSSSRFGLFTRRTKSPLEANIIESSERAAKKGPTAGTGHEGYGKYAAKRGRTGSVSTSTSRGRSTSTSGTSNSVARTPTSRKNSITSRGEPEMDDFLLERLAPVIISGGGGFLGIRDGSGESYQRPSEDDLAGRTSNEAPEIIPLASSQVGLTSALVATDPQLDRRRSMVFAERSAHSPVRQNLDLADQPRRPTLAARRSLHRSQLFKEAEPLKIPAPINTQVVSPSPVLDSYDTIHTSALMSDTAQVLTDDIREGKEGNWLRSRKTEKRAKSPRKWNFFQRTHVTSKTSEKKSPPGKDSVSEVPVTISRIPASRPVAHYAMLDNSDQGGSSSTVDLMPNFERRPQSPLPDIFFMNRQFDMDPPKSDHKLSMLLPSPPKLPREFNIPQGPPSPLRLPGSAPSHEFPFPSSTTILPQSEPLSLNTAPAEETPRPAHPRLRQVGRIPRVISKRERERAQAPAQQHSNFSRPFMRPVASSAETHVTTSRPADFQPALRPVLGVQTEILQSRPWETEDDSAKAKSAPVNASTAFSPASGVEFLTFPTRKGSEVSGSSSSGILNFAATTAVVPQPGIVAEDEVWNEYDELLDIIESPPPLINAKRNRTAPTPLHLRKESHITGLDAPPAIATSSPTGAMAPIGDLPLPPRRSRLLTSPTRESAEMVSTPLSFSDFFAGYGDRNRASAASKRQSISSGSRYSAQSRTSGVGSQRRSTRVSASVSGSPQRTTNSQHSRNSSSGKKRNTVIMAERTTPSSGAETNLRFSALMTSRWLSFGRVLFSPAHMEIQSNLHNRVLVLDGLGNDDWSFYCALTYPNATVYNLSPSSSTSNNNSNIQSPSNHRQIYHTSLSHRFPFPKSFFTAAVFRFPTASSESASYNAISECKRVLRPGGYLEMSILDLDMVNMGNRARRAVRQLKVRMQTTDSNISLKPASDNIQKMLGRRGYENLNRCMVNVPIAGRHISTSRSGSFSTASTSDQEDTKDVSLGDMLKESPTSQGDEGISKMVAKVGRWWYTRCYETAVLAKDNDNEQGESIWEDKQLLKECEKRETGLKLLICFAQKPEGVRRRTVSM
ncbi:hypothetical protein MMC31_003292 [Peltigera leucophlebia]|nr:hypothetical protein [Peltigera leucophlebia]